MVCQSVRENVPTFHWSREIFLWVSAHNWNWVNIFQYLLHKTWQWTTKRFTSNPLKIRPLGPFFFAADENTSSTETLCHSNKDSATSKSRVRISGDLQIYNSISFHPKMNFVCDSVCLHCGIYYFYFVYISIHHWFCLGTARWKAILKLATPEKLQLIYPGHVLSFQDLCSLWSFPNCFTLIFHCWVFCRRRRGHLDRGVWRADNPRGPLWQ